MPIKIMFLVIISSSIGCFVAIYNNPVRVRHAEIMEQYIKSSAVTNKLVQEFTQIAKNMPECEAH